ncbi:MAG: hypothetical protein GX957_04890 [Clostridiaceae bacterium]|nr:hypothetical protein [Clostridiaceae bacterium]
MKKLFTVMLSIALLFSSVGTVFANDAPITEIPLNSTIEFDVPINDLAEDATIEFYIVENEDGTFKVTDDFSIQASLVKATAGVVEWQDEYVILHVTCEVISGDYIKRFSGHIDVISPSLLFPETYDDFNFSLRDPAGTVHLSDEYDAWVGSDTDEVKVRMSNLRVETIYGEVGSLPSDTSSTFERD